MPTQVHASAPYVITPNAIEYATIRCHSAYCDIHAPFSNRIMGVMWRRSSSCRPQTIIARQRWLFGKVLWSVHYFGKPAPVAGTLCNKFSFHPTRARAWRSVLHSSLQSEAYTFRLVLCLGYRSAESCKYIPSIWRASNVLQSESLDDPVSGDRLTLCHYYATHKSRCW
jgi:hypothetical protein